MKNCCFFASFFAALCVGSSGADVSFDYSFTATFDSGPVTSVSGSFGGLFTPIIGSGPNVASLSYINLSILGTSYTIANTGVIVTNGHSLIGDNYEASIILGGIISDIRGVSPGTTDFGLAFFENGTGNISSSFAYSDTAVPLPIVGHVSVARVSKVSESGNPLFLMTACIISLATIARRRAISRL